MKPKLGTCGVREKKRKKRPEEKEPEKQNDDIKKRKKRPESKVKDPEDCISHCCN